MDRLLSEQEICKGCMSLGGENCDDCEYRAGAQDGATAQLAKADKEWVEWAFVICRNPSHSSGYWTKGSKLMQHQPRCECDECWAERKKEIGL